MATKMAEARNRPTGFDYMRLVLATTVILSHTFVAAYGNTLVFSWWSGPKRVVLGLILPPFFALSGFLVAGSLERTPSLISFLGLRAIRLIPALAVEVMLSALILGPIFTKVALSAYFSDRAFSHYFLNIAGDIHYFLPGVFQQNPSTFVNQQLWTVPFEMECYLALAALAIVGIAARRWLLLAAMALLQVGLALKLAWHGAAPLTILTGHVLVGCFLAGMVVFKFRDKVPHSLPLFLACLALTSALLLVPGGDQFISAPVAYVTVWLGTLNPKRNSLLLSGDYSYGLFLYGFPIGGAD